MKSQLILVVLLLTSSITVKYVYAVESAAASKFIAESSVSDTDMRSVISSYNYTQDPIAYNMGISSIAGKNGTYHIGLSQISTNNINLNSVNNAAYDGTFEVWGQTGRLNGFALGGTLQGGVIATQTGQPNTFGTTGVFFPSQAYLDYEYHNTLEITGGNILLTNPWVNSASGFPGATFANVNNTYQGINANLQVTPTLLLSGFRIFSYLQYPDNGFTQTSLYNSYAEIGNTYTPGAAGIGSNWKPSTQYTLNAWLYQFYDYADMWYLDNDYHLPLSDSVSMDFAIQALTQNANGNSIPAQTLIPNSSNQYYGNVSGNAVGAKWVISVPKNTITLAYNSIFGVSSSFLGGGIVSPYTYGLETDPLYTTPALSSLAELGSGNAYLIKDSLPFLDKSLIVNLAFSQFFIYKTIPTQPNTVTEYDAGLQYNIPHTGLNIWSRLVYLNQPNNAGGSLIQPRLIFNYCF